MSEEMNYTTVIFKNENNAEVIYDEVKTEENGKNCAISVSGNEKKTSCPLNVVVACLGIICIILVTVVIGLSIRLKSVISEQYRENKNLTTRNLKLQTENEVLQRQTEELTKERDGLNWTIGVILQYDNFPVKAHCTQKVCNPCLDEWLHFRSSCYLFQYFNYSSEWKKWEDSHHACTKMTAHLVVIESQEEQEFISGHIKYYSDAHHGYWMGLSQSYGEWMWIDGRNLTVQYWAPQQGSSRYTCGLAVASADPLATWQKKGCSMKNRWICERKALVKSD
ncbi:C-type lectin domain family 4 member A-like [Thalassophryne amazonica]|uniref:C-type lectin domain family 4 member A-like n=1 Tax=Thalassophryne amazonica TaxID=390379 RepID=UPI001471BD83|nr:C-type lectin domain family 4 member A-like [Thalassophryne amazonica]